MPVVIPDAVRRFWQNRPAWCFRPFAAGWKVSGEEKKLSIFQVLGSVLSSFIGVQKNATRERDFQQGRARDFIIVGVVLTVLFIVAVWGVVQLVMHVATTG